MQYKEYLAGLAIVAFGFLAAQPVLACYNLKEKSGCLGQSLCNACDDGGIFACGSGTDPEEYDEVTPVGPDNPGSGKFGYEEDSCIDNGVMSCPGFSTVCGYQLWCTPDQTTPCPTGESDYICKPGTLWTFYYKGSLDGGDCAYG